MTERASNSLTAKREGERQMLREFAQLDQSDPRRAALRDTIVTSHLPLVVAMANRFRDRGEPLDDLIQVGTVGLINAVDRFDPSRGLEFSTFATPTILGEIKRHFRDRGWAIRVPRRLQEMRIQVNIATEALTTELGRSPTVREIAKQTGLSEDDILDTLESAQAYSTLSLDAQSGSDDDGPSLINSLGTEEVEFEYIELRQTVGPLIEALDPRERRIVQMRFYDNMSQSQIAKAMGLSQMHVSRLLAKALDSMRQGLDQP
jgi:RNA polymerase sigma-B factor